MSESTYVRFSERKARWLSHRKARLHGYRNCGVSIAAPFAKFHAEAEIASGPATPQVCRAGSSYRWRSRPTAYRALTEMLFPLPCWRTLHLTRNTQKRCGQCWGALHKTSKRGICSSTKGGALASTHRWKRRRHVEDGSLASLKTGPKK